MHTYFYIGSLVTKLHLVCQGNLSLTFHYFKSFTNSLQEYTFEKQKQHTKSFKSHKNLIQHNKTHTWRSGTTPNKLQMHKEDQTSMVALLSQKRTFFKAPTPSQ